MTLVILRPSFLPPICSCIGMKNFISSQNARKYRYVVRRICYRFEEYFYWSEAVYSNQRRTKVDFGPPIPGRVWRYGNGDTAEWFHLPIRQPKLQIKLNLRFHKANHICVRLNRSDAETGSGSTRRVGKEIPAGFPIIRRVWRNRRNTA